MAAHKDEGHGNPYSNQGTSSPTPRHEYVIAKIDSREIGSFSVESAVHSTRQTFKGQGQILRKKAISG
jgi:hypothetical protein